MALWEKTKIKLQLALQFNFWIASDTCNSLFLYAVNVNGQVTWIVYDATHCNSIITLLKQLIFNSLVGSPFLTKSF